MIALLLVAAPAHASDYTPNLAQDVAWLTTEIRFTLGLWAETVAGETTIAQQAMIRQNSERLIAIYRSLILKHGPALEKAAGSRITSAMQAITEMVEGGKTLLTVPMIFVLPPDLLVPPHLQGTDMVYIGPEPGGPDNTGAGGTAFWELFASISVVGDYNTDVPDPAEVGAETQPTTEPDAPDDGWGTFSCWPEQSAWWKHHMQTPVFVVDHHDDVYLATIADLAHLDGYGPSMACEVAQ